MNDKFKIEVVIRKENNDAIDKFRGIINSYQVADLEHKIILNFPSYWTGFADGIMADMWKVMGEHMYIALAYFADSDDIVTDVHGDFCDSFEVIVDDKKVNKYVKKNLRIINIKNKEENVFGVKAYVFDIRLVPPIVKILDVYSGSKDSGVKLNMFASGNR